MPQTLAERIERAAEAEARRFFAEQLRRDYRISQDASESVLDALAQYVRDEGGSPAYTLLNRSMETLLNHVYVANKGNVIVTVDTTDSAEVALDGRVTYFRLDVACTLAHATYPGPRVEAAHFAPIAARLRTPQQASRLPR
jgi:glycerol-3-phosphate O-acyltransferase